MEDDGAGAGAAAATGGLAAGGEGELGESNSETAAGVWRAGGPAAADRDNKGWATGGCCCWRGVGAALAWGCCCCWVEGARAWTGGGAWKQRSAGQPLKQSHSDSPFRGAYDGLSLVCGSVLEVLWVGRRGAAHRPSLGLVLGPDERLHLAVRPRYGTRRCQSQWSQRSFGRVGAADNTVVCARTYCSGGTCPGLRCFSQYRFPSLLPQICIICEGEGRRRRGSARLTGCKVSSSARTDLHLLRRPDVQINRLD